MLAIRGLERDIQDNSYTGLGVAVGHTVNALAVDDHSRRPRPSSQ